MITDSRQAFRHLLKALPPAKQRELKNRFLREDRVMANWPEALGAKVASPTLLQVSELPLIETRVRGDAARNGGHLEQVA